MKCSVCSFDTVVKDSRPAFDEDFIRRRRECPNCHHRFTTIEIEIPNLSNAKIDIRNFIYLNEDTLKELANKVAETVENASQDFVAQLKRLKLR